MVAFRVDPCFANIGPITNVELCKNQLRIIFQPIVDTSATDGGIHAFYTLTRAELTALVGEVVALRTSQSSASSSGPLAVHPLLTSQGLLGAEAKGLRDIVLKYAGTENLIRMTKFNTDPTGVAWSFSGFDIVGATSSKMVIPNLPAQATEVMFRSDSPGNQGDMLRGDFIPTAIEGKDQVGVLASVETAGAATVAARQSAFDALLRIEHPGTHSPDTIDCANCHATSGVKAYVASAYGLTANGNTNAFVADGKYVAAADMVETTQQSVFLERMNVHMFSYSRERPFIATRVINETAAVVAYLNEISTKK